MADGALNLTLDDYTSTRLAEKAKALGVTREALAAQVIAQIFATDSFGDPAEDNASNYDLNEEGRPWSEVRPELVARMERKRVERA